MAHFRRAVGPALLLNTTRCAVEGVPRMPHPQLTTRNQRRTGMLRIALASIVAVTLCAPSALGFVCIETSHGQCIHWTQHAATLRSFLGNLGDDNAINAANDWSSVGANFRFTVTVGGQFVDPCGPEGANHLCPNTGPAGDNPIVVASTFCGQGFGDIIELTNDCWTASTGAILNAPVFVNDTLLLDVYDGPLRFVDGQIVYDIRRVLLHEFGHVLGLDHPNDHGQTVAAIMNSHVSDLDRLQTDDISGIFSQYGGPTPSGCAGDCNGNADVRIDELITLVDIALGNLPLSACAAGEPESVSEITVSDVIVALNSARSGCVK